MTSVSCYQCLILFETQSFPCCQCVKPLPPAIDIPARPPRGGSIPALYIKISQVTHMDWIAISTLEIAALFQPPQIIAVVALTMTLHEYLSPEP